MRCAISGAIVGMICTALAPVPMMPTDFPAMSNSWSQSVGRWILPPNELAPAIPMSALGRTKAPTALTKNRAVTTVPSEA
ncbi:Uncharacterised protein [Mycobacteroides abscessus]|nr:Uncharacterised protein [Mycobacteroides abscessus]